MCTNPIKIKNPNKGRDPTKYINRLKDCTSEYIYVPCKNCPECIAMQQMELVQRVQMEALKNWLFMGTLTYKNEYLPSLVTSQGYEYKYSEIKDFTDMVKRLRKNNTFEFPFRIVYVSERGGKRGRPHFHCLMIFDKNDIGKTFEEASSFAQIHKWDLFNEWKRVTKKGRYSKAENLCDYRESYRNGILRSTYDFHFVDPRLTGGGVTDVAFYVLKYMMKGSKEEKAIKSALYTNYDKEEAECYWNTIKTKQIHSKGFGLNGGCDWDIIEHLRQGVERSKTAKMQFPSYFAPEQIMTFPLAHYYKEKGIIYDWEDAVDFYNITKRPEGQLDSIYDFNKEITQTFKKMHDYERKLNLIKQDCFSEIEELYEI